MVAINMYNDCNKTTAGELDKLVGDATLRPYLGCSRIGHSCMRFLWYEFRWAFKGSIDARLKRLFWRGHREEPEIIKELQQIGIRCYDDQAECNFVSGHMSGHCDGKCIGVPEAPHTEHLLEFKTASDKKFKEMKKKKVQQANPTYYAQLQIYMKGLHLTRALFIMVNKNNDEYYVERVRYDAGFADDLIRKGTSIVLAETPPSIASPFGPTWFECKWCDAKEVCFGATPINKTCRTCQAIHIMDGGKWGCTKLGIELATGQQRLACNLYEVLGI